MTAIQTTPAPMRGIGHLPPEIQQALELRKSRNLVAAQIAGLSWGSGIDQDTRRAVASWGQQFRVDVTTEIHVLGGRVYLNAAFYLRRLGELIDAGLVEYAIADHVEDDSRLAKMGAEGEGEATRRLRERLKHGIPDKCVSAVVFRVKLRSMDQEVNGSKWCGTGKLNAKGNLADPIGEQFPVETSESRAARRTMRLLSSHVPPEVADSLRTIEGSAEVLSDRVEQSRARVKEVEARELEEQRPPQMISAGPAGDPYELGGTEERAEEKRPVVSGVKSATESAGVSGSSSSAQSSVAPQQRAPAPTPPATPATPTVAQFKMPYSIGTATVGTPLSQVSTADLVEAVNFARLNGRFAEFLEKATALLDDRRLGDADEPGAKP